VRELARVSGDQGEIVFDGMAGDEDIERADGLSGGGEVLADLLGNGFWGEGRCKSRWPEPEGGEKKFYYGAFQLLCQTLMFLKEVMLSALMNPIRPLQFTRLRFIR